MSPTIPRSTENDSSKSGIHVLVAPLKHVCDVRKKKLIIGWAVYAAAFFGCRPPHIVYQVVGLRHSKRIEFRCTQFWVAVVICSDIYCKSDCLSRPAGDISTYVTFLHVCPVVSNSQSWTSAPIPISV